MLILGTNTLTATGEVRAQTKGYTLIEDSFVVSLEDGRTTVEMIDTLSAEVDIYRNTLESQAVSITEMEKAYLIYKKETEEKAQNDRLTIAKQEKKIKRLSKPWSLGAFGGYDVIHSEAVVGVGICYSIIRF